MRNNAIRLLIPVGLWLAANVAGAAKSPPASEQMITADGAALFEQHCAECHSGKVSKAPQISLLQIMSPGSVLRAMEAGVMRTQAAALSGQERRAIAEHLTGKSLADAAVVQPAPSCMGESARFDFAAQPDSQGWGVTHDNRRFFNKQMAGLTAADLPRLELKWAFAYPDATRGRSQPATAGGGLFVGSQNGSVFSLDQKTGCLRWEFQTTAEVRTGIVVESWESDRAPPLLFFGDLIGNVYAVNAVTGELAWRDRPNDHPSLTITAAPALFEGRLYVALSSLEVTAAADPTYACCTFRGGVAVYDAKSGERLWTGYTIDVPPAVVGKNSVGTDRIAPSGSPIWGTPVIDPKRGVMYVGTGENYSSPANDTSDAILALSLEDGRIVWSQQMTVGDAWNMGCETKERINCPPEDGPDYDFGAATILATNSEGKDIVLAGQKSGEVFGLDPDNGGKILWRNKIGRGGIQGGVHFGMAVDGDTLYVPMSDFDGGARWPGTPYPGMYALDISSGKVQWYTPAKDQCDGRELCQPGLSAAASAIEGGVVGGAMDGRLRAYDTATGKVLWEYDAVRSFETLDGGQARGGSFGGAAGPVFKDGMMFVNAGYGIYFHMPGNVLLAFGLPEESQTSAAKTRSP
tara:strand:- start:3331 stop:5232 length:1902 start_codon:yes stop_codon:yes gene_type:complete